MGRFLFAVVVVALLACGSYLTLVPYLGVR